MDQREQKIHFVGIGGVGTGGLAQALCEKGFTVSGSDGAIYDPMKTVLEKTNIRLLEGFLKENLTQVQPDLVVIANVVRKDNPEAMAWIQSDTPFISFPEAVRRFAIGERKSVIVAGTHGKTTTTSWIAYLLDALQLNPSYLIGGVPHDSGRGSHIAEGSYFVGEGDEYDSAFFDKGPKFLHYKPDFLVLLGIEFDHADIYRDLEHVTASFKKLIALLPGDGLCVACSDDPTVMSILSDALCPVQTFGVKPTAMWRLGKVEQDAEGYRFEVIYKRRNVGEFRSPLFGEFNLLNLLSGIICGVNLGVSLDQIRPLVAQFRGVRRRQEILMNEPILVMDDFAHHPSEVRATLKGVRDRYPDRKIWAIFEPRSATARRNTFQDEYVKSFDSADHILVTQPYRGEEIPSEKRFSTEVLIEKLASGGKSAQMFENGSAILEYFLKHYAKDDIAVVMSNGEFDKISKRMVESLT